MVGAGVVANLYRISGNGELPLMVPGVIALDWLGWEALWLARSGGDSRSAIVRDVQRMIPLAFACIAAVIATLNMQRAWQPTGELAQRLNISRQSVNAIETGKYNPSLPLAFRIAALFAMRSEEIFSSDEEAAGA